MPRSEELISCSSEDDREDDEVLSQLEEVMLNSMLDDTFYDTEEDESSDDWYESSDGEDALELYTLICATRQLEADSKASEKKDKKRQLNEEKSKSNEVESKVELPAAKKTKLSPAEEDIKTLNAKFDTKAAVKSAEARGDRYRRRVQALPK